MQLPAPPPLEYRLPTWPVTAMAVLLPLCWLLGVRDFAWMVAAVPMVSGLSQLPTVRVPGWFGLWLLFVTWMLLSVIQIDSVGRLLGFGFRALLYGSATVVLVYVYNLARQGVDWSRVAAAVTALWLVVVVGGFLGVFFPDVTLRTPASYLFPAGLAQNDVIAEMVRPGLAQYFPDSYYEVPPRPSAPFAYTNNWGNAYSLMLPFVLVQLGRLPAGRQRVALSAALVLSLVPALLTLNRGMYLALALGLSYVGIRMALRGQTRGIVAVAGLALTAAVAVQVLPVADLLEQRLASSSTNETRLSVYDQAFDGVLASPVFGFGGPRPAAVAGQPAVGTQGQFWMVLFSHGFVGAALFVGWLLVVCLRSARPPDNAGLWLHAVLMMAALEIFYYGILGAGLTVVMIAAGLTSAQPPVRRSERREPVSVRELLT